MATVYDQITIGSIDIVDTYKKLMGASTEQGSIYIKAKETLSEYVLNGDLSDKEKVTLMANYLANLTTQLSAQAMEMAFKLDKENKDAPYVLTKLQEDTRVVTANVTRLDKEIDSIDKDNKLKTYNGWKAQAELYWDYGIKAYNLSTVDDIVTEINYDKTIGTKKAIQDKTKADMFTTLATNYRQSGDLTISSTGLDVPLVAVVQKAASVGAPTIAEVGNVYKQTELVDSQKSKMTADVDNIVQDTKLKVYTGWKLQGDVYWDYGIKSYNMSTSTDLVTLANITTDFGIKRQTISKAQADVYTTLATNYRQNGSLTINSTDAVFSANSLPVGLNIQQSATVPGAPTAAEYGLTYEQTLVAERQIKGFDDNKKQHVINSSASLVSMLLATEEASLVDDATTALNKWTLAADYLNA